MIGNRNLVCTNHHGNSCHRDILRYSVFRFFDKIVKQKLVPVFKFLLDLHKDALIRCKKSFFSKHDHFEMSLKSYYAYIAHKLMAAKERNDSSWNIVMCIWPPTVPNATSDLATWLRSATKYTLTFVNHTIVVAMATVAKEHWITVTKCRNSAN